MWMSFLIMGATVSGTCFLSIGLSVLWEGHCNKRNRQLKYAQWYKNGAPPDKEKTNIKVR